MSDAANLPVQIRQVSQLGQRGAWKVEHDHSLGHHRVLWFTRGQGRISFAAKHRTFGPNSVVFIPAGWVHSFEIKQSVFGSVIDIDALDFLEMPASPLHIRIRDVLEQGRFVGLVENMQREFLAQGSGQSRACLYHAGLMGVWLERTAKLNEIWDLHLDATQSLVNRYQTLIETRLGSGDNVSSYADQLNVTPTHLTRCCKTCLGQSALAILNQRIMYQARQYLRETKLPIKQVAEHLGFTSAAYFTRAFLQNTGATPSEYRQTELG